MYTTAFDASGKEDDPNTRYVVVAGFVSTAKVWEQFDAKWRKRLTDDNLPRFHMTDWRHRVRLFGDRDYWTRQRCDALMNDLLTILISHSFYKFGCAVSVASLDQHISDQTRQDFLINAYVLAARGVIDRADEWTLYRDRQPIEHVLEEGDEGKGLLVKRLEIEGKATPSFRWSFDRRPDKTGNVVPGFTPLQGSDIYASELLRFAREWPKRGNVKSDVLRRLDDIQGEARAFSAQNLQELNDWIEIIASDPDFWNRYQSL